MSGFLTNQKVRYSYMAIRRYVRFLFNKGLVLDVNGQNPKAKLYLKNISPESFFLKNH